MGVNEGTVQEKASELTGIVVGARIAVQEAADIRRSSVEVVRRSDRRCIAAPGMPCWLKPSGLEGVERCIGENLVKRQLWVGGFCGESAVSTRSDTGDDGRRYRLVRTCGDNGSVVSR